VNEIICQQCAAQHQLPRKSVTSAWFSGKIDSLEQQERLNTELNFGSNCWNNVLLSWKTWPQGKNHARMDGGRNCKKIIMF